jgi:cold shock protein
MDSEHVIKARELEEKSMWTEAAHEYLEALVIHNTKEISEKAAWCFSRAGQYDEAIKLLGPLFSIEPQIAKWPYMIGYQFYCKQDWAKAVEWFEKSLVINPDYFVVKYRLAYAYVQLAGKYKQLTKAEYWKALGHLKDCHKLWEKYPNDKRQKENSTYFSINFLHGKILMDMPNSRAKAVTLFQKALIIKPDDISTQYNLAKTYYLLGGYKEAKQYLPHGSQYYITELNAYIDAKLGEYNFAISQIKQLLQKREKDYLYNFLAEQYLLVNDLDSAFDMSERAITLGQNNHKNYYTAAKIYFKFGLLSKAMSTLDIALQLKEKRYGSIFVECKSLRDEISSKIMPSYFDDKELLNRLSFKNPSRNQSFLQGNICKYNSSKGFGFIQSNGKDIFFHVSNCKFRDINVGDKVVFRTGSTPKGLNAIEIMRISSLN